MLPYTHPAARPQPPPADIQTFINFLLALAGPPPTGK